jgi:hypothetical protein
MTRRVLSPVVFFVVLLALASTWVGSVPKDVTAESSAVGLFRDASGRNAAHLSDALNPRALASYAHLPLSFEANEGQTDKRVRFLSRGNAYTLFLTSREMVLTLGGIASPGRSNVPSSREKTVPGPGTVTIKNLGKRAGQSSILRIMLSGANRRPAIEGADVLPGKSNYFIGNDRRKWRTNVPSFAKVKYHDIYPGVDLVYYGNQGQLEHDFVVSPGADPGVIRLRVKGTRRIAVDRQGDLSLGVPGGDVRLQRPIVYQDIDGTRQTISAQYQVIDGNQVAFQISSYDIGRPLVIDPVLVYATYLGGTSTDFTTAGDLHVDSAGNAYLCGLTYSANFPTTSGANQTSLRGGYDAFVTKLNPSGSALVYSTFLGGSGLQGCQGSNIDSSGNAYVAISTNSTDFPTTSGAFQTTYPGSGPSRWIVAKLDPTGSTLLYSTYLGGTCCENGPFGIAVDGSGNAYVGGYTQAADFPTTPGAYLTTYPGAPGGVLVKLNATGSGLLYSTFIGGANIYGVAVDDSGNAYITGSANASLTTTAGAPQTTYGGGNDDGYLAKLNPTGSALLYSTYVGGSGDDFLQGIAIDGAGNAYATGFTTSSNFPVTAGAYQTVYAGNTDVAVVKLNPTGTALVYSTYVGGPGDDVGGKIAIDSSGNADVLLNAYTGSFPTTANALQGTFPGGRGAAVVQLSPDGSSLLYSSYVGGNGDNRLGGIAVNAHNDIYFAIDTDAVDAPIANALQPTNAGGHDIYLAKIQLSPRPLTITANSTTMVLNGAIPALSASYSGFVNGDTPASLTGTLSCTTTATVTSPVGNYPITCSGQSSSNYTITYVPATLNIQYASGGICDGDVGHQILQPVNADGTSVWKQGRTIPVKFRVCDANGVSIGTVGVISSFVLTQIISGTVTTVDETIDASTIDSGFRFDPTAQQWIFNLSTKPESAGFTYVYSINLNDGTSIVFQYGLR